MWAIWDNWLKPLLRPAALSAQEIMLLQGLVNGCTLKSHRDLDGHKIYQLHPLVGPAQSISYHTVKQLQRRGFIAGNHKFPAATYLLTDKGKRVAETLTDDPLQPVSARRQSKD